MAKNKENECFARFAWLIYKEVERYVNTHKTEYEIWAQSAKSESAEKREE